MSTVTMSQIAEVAEVSQATVSFVLNGRVRQGGSISESTAQRVKQVARELGYRPNRAARALATGKSHLIGLAMWNLAEAHYSSVTRHTEDQLKNTENHLLVGCLNSRLTQNDPLLLQSTFPWPLDGVLALEASHVLKTHWEKFQEWPAPIVSMGGTHYQVDNLDYVGVDLTVGVREALVHLMNIGCKDIAFAAQNEAMRQDELRFKAYREVMEQQRKQPKLIPLSANSRSAAREGMRFHLSNHSCPDGILCFNDEVALGIYRAMCDLGISVPRQVALAGCDGIESMQYLECPITTIVQPVQEMCQVAWHMLHRRIESPHHAPQQKVLLPHLAVRESTQYFGGNVT